MNAQVDWDDLRLFLAVARTGSLTAAADALGLHHTTVSRRLDHLEGLLSTRLVDRLARGTRLTAAGQALLGPATAVEEDVLAATRAVAGHDQELTGVVRLTTTDDLVPRALPLLRSFRERYPGVVVELDAADVLRDLRRREADVALRATERPPDEAIAWPISTCAWAPYAAPGAPPCHVMLGESLRHLSAHRWQREHLGEVRVAAVVGSVGAAVAAARAGLGAAVLPCFVADEDPALARVGPVLPGVGGAVWLLVHADLRRNARVRALAEHLREGLVALRPLFEGARPRVEDAVTR